MRNSADSGSAVSAAAKEAPQHLLPDYDLRIGDEILTLISMNSVEFKNQITGDD